MSPELAYVISYALLIFMKVVCFILGYLIVRLGYTLIASGVKGEFKFSASLGGVKADLASISPGLLFVVLGVFLIGYAIFVEKEVNLKYFQTSPQTKPAPPNISLPMKSPFVSEEETHGSENMEE
jgi:hypothetical protein